MQVVAVAAMAVAVDDEAAVNGGSEKGAFNGSSRIGWRRRWTRDRQC